MVCDSIGSAFGISGCREMLYTITDGSVFLYLSQYLQQTALFWASENGHVEIVQLLLDRGADPNTVDDVRIIHVYMRVISVHTQVACTSIYYCVVLVLCVFIHVIYISC